jgi:PAS domain S-box-containing protein
MPYRNMNKDDIEVLFEDIVKTIKESIILLDSDMKVIFVNSAFYDTFKTTPKNTINVPVYNLGNGQWDISELHELLEKILPKNSSFDGFEVEHDFQDIGKKFMRLNARKLLDGKRKEQFILLVIEDVTQQKKFLDYAIREGKLSSIGHLSAGIAHGLNSPLTGLYNFLNVYIEQEKAGSEKYKELKLMLEGCEYMSQIIKNLTYFSGDKKEKFTEINLKDVIDSAMLITDRQLISQDIELVKDVPENLKFMGIKSQMQHAVLNIVVNSMEAIEGSGKITVKARKSKENIILEIIDTGNGISKENLQNVFLPFFTTKEDTGGSGLGLAAAHGIIKRHNGTIKIESELGKGTDVIITLPGANNK